MNVIYAKQSLDDLASFDRKLQGYFLAHIEKLLRMPPRRHMKFGLPFHVETITRQARLVYEERDDVLYVIRCFATHKEYENWYNSFR